MINIPMKSKGCIDRNTISSINTLNVQGCVTSQSIETLNIRKTQGNVPHTNMHSHTSTTPAAPMATASPTARTAHTTTAPHAATTAHATTVPHAATIPAQRQLPPLKKPVQKGQKVSIETSTPLTTIKACFGWNTTNSQCEVDVSAYLLGANGKVLGDDWFIFYGQTISPDQSTEFHVDNSTDCEMISMNLQKLNPDVKKIVFVLTINEAFEKKLHFGMMKDAYVRILNAQNGEELVSFQMTDYYSNAISMMIGEVYQHNGIWKFNAIGNGVAKDLLGLCELYGVEVSD